MKLVTIRADAGALRAGLLVDGMAVELQAVADAAGLSVPGLAGVREPALDPWMPILERWDEARSVVAGIEEGAAGAVTKGDVAPAPADRLGPPLARPGKIICVGLNYADHAAETGQPIPTVPVLFAKFATSICGSGDRVVRPAEVTDLDYEAELGVVIGRRAKGLTVADAPAAVAGYLCANDVSARTAQLQTGQWVRGKSFDTFCPIGPVLVEAGEVTDVQALGIRCWVDGEIRQDSNTSQMVFSVAELVAYCSQSFTLEPGDLILTGTPPGVAMGRTPSPWLQPGQTCSVEIDGLGCLSNPIVAAAVTEASCRAAG